MIDSMANPGRKKQGLRDSMILFGVLAALTTAHATAQTAVVSDATFLNANWTVTTFILP